MKLYYWPGACSLKFETEMDDEARRAMFRHLHEQVA
jgi:hypothetical protein